MDDRIWIYDPEEEPAEPHDDTDFIIDQEDFYDLLMEQQEQM